MWRSLPMPDDHAWAVTAGHKVVVADRGAVSIEVPADWLVTVRDDGVLQATDAAPPADDCRIELSVLRLPLATGHTITLSDVLDVLRTAEDEGARSWAPAATHVEQHDHTRLAWAERMVPDAADGRPIITRTIVAAASTHQAVTTFSVFADLEPRFASVWATLRSTIRLDRRLDLSGRDAHRN